MAIGIGGDMEAGSLVLLAAACSGSSVRTSPRRQRDAEKAEVGRDGAQAWYHLHSTATVFCVGEAEDGLMPVSDEPDDVDAVVWDTVDQKSKVNSIFIFYIAETRQ